MFDQEQWEQLLASFLEEAKELIQSAETALLALDEQVVDAETINGLFRAMHTLKGSAGLFSLDGFVRFAHHMENLIMRVRDGELTLNSDMVTALLSALDVLGNELTHLEQTGTPSALDTDNPQLLALLQQLTGETVATPPATTTESADTIERHPAPEDKPASWHISLRFDRQLLQYGFDPASFVRYLNKLGTVQHLYLLQNDLPAWPDFQAEQCYLGLELDLQTEASKTEIESVFEFIQELAQIRILPPDSHVEDYLALIDALPQDKDRLGEILIASGLLTESELQRSLQKQTAQSPAPKIGDVLIQEGNVPAVAVDAALQKQQQIREQKQHDSALLKISAKKMDELINLVGELVIAAAGGEMLARQHGNSTLQEAMSTINQHVEQIREVALQLRMVEIGDTFMRFHRLVRDTSKELNKEIQLHIEGADTELDKTVVDKIADPLTHLVRNALDHGIEPAEERLSAGKNVKGMVRLNAYHESGNVVIEVQDDGRGLNPGRIREKALEKGLISTTDQLNDQALYQLIFAPGFSTAESISNLSGRGVGMDVVKRSIDALRGTIELDSIPGRGCCVRIRLPLTLAIIDGFLISVGETPLVLPLQSVTECLEARYADIGDRTYSYLELRGKPLPIVRLREHFGVESKKPQRENIVVVRQGKQQLGLVVDTLLGEQQIVIKPLGALFEHLHDISGSSILGSGHVALILDIPGLQQRVHHRLNITMATPCEMRQADQGRNT
ncbi:chemotaxis protein CheA [Tolumonas lignilytica]|uniref:chemotaxis protein CheA n=1 Tax=Tolumonas lignilytica TaxID=1283284 RepID=UPI0004673CC1|nr:chemotaxis protein CheA [Tolumonas lignilytica]